MSMSNYEYDYNRVNTSNNKEIDDDFDTMGVPNMSSPSRNNDIKTLDTIKYTNRESIRENARSNQEDYSMSSTPENKLRLQLMEKDKIIFEFSKTLKETERVLENTKKLNSAKEEVIVNLKDEIKDLKFRCKNVENLLRHKEEEMEKYKNYSEEKVIFLNKEKSLVEEKLLELTNLFENNQVDFQNTLIEYKKIEKQLVKLKQSFGEKNEVIGNYEKTIEGLKKENKSIMGLKKQIEDMEGYINELKQEIVNERRNGQRIQSDKEEVERKFKEFIEESRSEKEMAGKALKMTYEIESLKRDYSEKKREIENLNEKYKNLVKDNDNFVLVITNEIGQFTSLLESPSLATKGLLKRGSYSNNLQFGSQFSLKYELINKNFEILKNKMIEIYNSSITMISKLEKNNSELDKNSRELQTEKDAQLKELSITRQKLEDLIDRSDELLNENTKLNEEYKNLKQNYVKSKTDYEDVVKRNDAICGEIQVFMNNCYSKLKDKFPDMNLENFPTNSKNDSLSITSGNSSVHNLNYAEKILYYLDILLNDYEKLSVNEKEYLESVKLSQIQIKNLDDEKELLKARIERILQNKEDELQRAEVLRTEELKRQREVLYEKISSMTGLLEESNQMISLYESENKELKEKISKLEFNLKMLTNSHLELENSITGNISTLQNEVDEKENKYNKLLREIELKSVHIESIENILKRKEDEIDLLKNEIHNLNSQIEYEREYKSSPTIGSKARDDREMGENIDNADANLPTSHFSNEGNYAQSNLHSYDHNNQNIPNYMASSTSSFRPNEENEKELKRLINNYNSQSEENINTRDGHSQNSIQKEYGKIRASTKISALIKNQNLNNSTSSQISQKIPGKIYSIKKN